MSASVEASDLLKRLAEPAPAGAHIETLIRGVARKVGLTFRRAKALWYREAAVVRSEEMDALRAAARARGEAEGELKVEYRTVIARIEELERRLDATGPHMGRAQVPEAGHGARAAGLLDCAVDQRRAAGKAARAYDDLGAVMTDQTANLRRQRILAEWAKGYTETEIARKLGVTAGVVGGVVQRSQGPYAEQAKFEHKLNRAAREPASYRDQDSLDREARVLRDWADGWSCTDIAIRIGDGFTRNTAMGIVNRSRGAVAEKAKNEHPSTAAIRYPKGSPRVKRALPESAQRDRIISARTVAEKRRAKFEPKPVLSGRALADRKAKNMAAQQAAIARVELRLLENPAFVKVEKPWDAYSHLRSDKGYLDAMAALTR